MSALTIAEVLHLKGFKREFPKEMRETLRKFFRRRMFTIVDVDRFIAEQAQDIFWDHDIEPKDSIHVATALATNCNFLETFDGPLLQKSRGLGGDPLLVIQEPGVDLFRRDQERRAAAEKAAAGKPPTLEL